MNQVVKMPKLATSAAHLTIAQIIAALISLITAMLLSRFCTVEEYGTYSQLNIAVTIMCSLAMLGLPNSINYFLGRAEMPEERRSFLSVYYTVSTLICIVIGVILVAALPLIEHFFDNERLSTYFYYLLIYPWAKISISAIANVLVVYGKTIRLMLVNFLAASISMVSVTVVWVFGLTFDVFVVLYVIGNSIIALATYAMVLRLEKGVRPSFNWTATKRILSYSIPIGLAGLVGTLNAQIDQLMIGSFLDTVHLGYYANASKELPLSFVATSITAVLLPRMAKLFKNRRGQEAIQLWGISVELSYFFVCFFSTACVVFSPQIITFLYSEKYLPGLSVFIVYSLSLLLRVTYFGMLLNSTGNTRLILWASIASLAVNTCLNYPLFILCGFIGPAVATLISTAVINIIQLAVSSNILKVSFSAIFPWGRLAFISFANIFWGILAWAICHLIKVGVDSQGVLEAIAIGLFAAAAYFLAVRKRIVHLWNSLNETQ